MDILKATQDYEAWLAGFTSINLADLEYKHQQMANKDDAFPFFRGTYYRWAQHWAASPKEWREVPEVFAIGDLHIENFGTWRDAEGRLCWGINDFDEADRLPFTQDLVRLATSVRLAKHANQFDIKLASACKAILDGYFDSINANGISFVLEEKNQELRAMATAQGRDPLTFWKKLEGFLADAPINQPIAALDYLLASIPADAASPLFRHRPKVGMGSLGKPRILALVNWKGAWIAREAKPTTPPSSDWAQGKTTYESPLVLTEVLHNALRSHDPYYQVKSDWTVRRLAPLCSRIELGHLKQSKQIELVLKAMGSEIANVHLGTPNCTPAIRASLVDRNAAWLEEASRQMAKLMEDDWTAWRSRAS